MDSYLLIITWAPMETMESLKATIGKRVTTLISLYPDSLLLLSAFFCQSLVFPGRLCSKLFQHILETAGLSQAEL